jgi:hypothetical protein
MAGMSSADMITMSGIAEIGREVIDGLDLVAAGVLERKTWAGF